METPRKGMDYTGVSIVFACHDGNGNFLLQKRGQNCRDEQGKLDIGGGGLDFNDTVEDTLRKEIREEYTTEVQSFEFLGYRDVHRTHNDMPTHWIALDFLVHIDPSTVSNGEPHKFDDIGWFKLGVFPEPQHSVLPLFLEKYRKQMQNAS